MRVFIGDSGDKSDMIFNMKLGLNHNFICIDKEDNLVKHITGQKFDFLKDGKNVTGQLEFKLDGRVLTSENADVGKWQVVDPSQRMINFEISNVEYNVSWNENGDEATVLNHKGCKLLPHDTQYDLSTKPSEDIWGSEGLEFAIIRVPINSLGF